MKTRAYIALLVFSALSFGQTKTWVVDDNLRTCLQGIDGGLFDASDSLIVTQANVFGSQINCGGDGIVNVDQLKYFTSVTSLSLMGNDVAQVDSLIYLTSLESLYLSNNELTDLPDLSAFPSLRTLFCEGNTLTNLDGIESTVLESINCAHNQLTDVTVLSGLPLTWVVGDDNLLDSLPDVLSFPNVTFWSFRNNILPIYYHEQASLHPNFNADFEVKPTVIQKVVSVRNVRVGHEVILSIPNIDSLSSSSFTWYKDGTPIAASNDWRLINSDVTLSDSGIYTCIIAGLLPATNDISYTVVEIDLNVTSCDVDLLSFDYESVFTNCTEGYEIGFGTPDWGVAPYSYQLNAMESMEEITVNENSVSGIKEYQYELTIIDADLCEAQVSGGIDLEEQDCTEDEVVFTPNGDGDHDYIFIPDSGEAKVYDTDQGLLLNTLAIPSQWGGLDNQGSVLDDGYYLIVINGEKSMVVALKK